MSLFVRAQKSSRKLKAVITGPAGSGKTQGALMIAKGLGEKIALVDTENASASLYSDKFVFDTAAMNPPYVIEKYLRCIKDAEENKYDVLIIDSLTHAWAGEGGLLSIKEQMDQRPGANSFANWGKLTPEYNKLMHTITHSSIHIICTMRSKTDYVLQENDRGKMAPVKMGLAPQFRDGAEYEFDLHLDVDINHNAIALKDRLEICPKLPKQINLELGEAIKAALSTKEENK